MNAAPPKPTRLLSEPERKAMLKHDMSPGTPDIPTALLTPNTGNQHIVHVVTEKETKNVENDIENYMNSNNIGWDTATEELLMTLDRQHLFPGFGDNSRLEFVDLDSDFIQAPLASPEGLSEASSMCTLNREGSLPKGDYRPESVSVALQPIEQSPEICVKNEDSEQNLSVMESYDTPYLSIPRKSLNESVSVGDFLKKSHLLGALELDLIAHSSQGSLNNLLPVVDDDGSTDDFYRDNVSVYDNIDDNSTNGFEIKAKHNDREQLEVGTCTRERKLIEKSYEENKNHSNNATADIENSGLSVMKYGAPNYGRHSPDESSQFGYSDPNEIYSAASTGYSPPQISIEEIKPSVRLHSSDSSPKSPHPNKILQYSQSESRLKGLSEEYTMRRSTEEGDIAHLEDNKTIFVHSNLDKVLKSRESDPAMNVKLLTKNFSDYGLQSVKEIEGNDECEETFDEPCINTREDDTNLDKGYVKSDRCFDFFGEKHSRREKTDVNDQTGLLERKESDDDKTVTEENRPLSVNSKTSETVSAGLVSNLSSPDEADRRLFHSNSCHSTFASSTSGESEQRLSLISANSEDLPIVETDV